MQETYYTNTEDSFDLQLYNELDQLLQAHICGTAHKHSVKGKILDIHILIFPWSLKTGNENRVFEIFYSVEDRGIGIINTFITLN